MDQAAVSAKTSPRRRPLETCGATILAMACVFHNRSQNAKSRTAKIANKTFRAAIYAASLTSPFHCHLLAMLSVADDHILALQETLETYFPFSRFLSTKIQDFLAIAEALPEKVDNVLEKTPGSVDMAVVLDWALVLVIYWLEWLVGGLTRFKDKNTKEKEKEIVVDKSFSRHGSMSLEEEHEEEEVKDQEEPENRRATYKEVLQKGTGGEDGSGSGSDNDGNSILELFEMGWILNPVKRSRTSTDSLMLSPSDS